MPDSRFRSAAKHWTLDEACKYSRRIRLMLKVQGITYTVKCVVFACPASVGVIPNSWMSAYSKSGMKPPLIWLKIRQGQRQVSCRRSQCTIYPVQCRGMPRHSSDKTAQWWCQTHGAWETHGNLRCQGLQILLQEHTEKALFQVYVTGGSSGYECNTNLRWPLPVGRDCYSLARASMSSRKSRTCQKNRNNVCCFKYFEYASSHHA